MLLSFNIIYKNLALIYISKLVMCIFLSQDCCKFNLFTKKNEIFCKMLSYKNLALYKRFYNFFLQRTRYNTAHKYCFIIFYLKKLISGKLHLYSVFTFRFRLFRYDTVFNCNYIRMLREKRKRERERE